MISSSGPGQSIVRKTINQIDRLQHQQIPVELHWIPAHKNIKGKEAADRAAKSAAGCRLKHKRNGRTIETDTGITAAKADKIPIQKAPVQTTLARLAASNWAISWSQDNHGKGLRNIAPHINYKWWVPHMERGKYEGYCWIWSLLAIPACLLSTLFLLRTDLLSTLLLFSSSMLFLSVSCT